MNVSRRGFIQALTVAAAAAATADLSAEDFDIERFTWVPGRKLFMLPPREQDIKIVSPFSMAQEFASIVGPKLMHGVLNQRVRLIGLDPTAEYQRFVATGIQRRALGFQGNEAGKMNRKQRNEAYYIRAAASLVSDNRHFPIFRTLDAAKNNVPEGSSIAVDSRSGVIVRVTHSDNVMTPEKVIHFEVLGRLQANTRRAGVILGGRRAGKETTRRRVLENFFVQS